MIKSFFMPLSRVAVFLLIILSFSACGKKNPNGDFPKDFQSYRDADKVKYVMENATPDSVARFICNASIGAIPGITIDSVADATLYAYEKYRGPDLDKFSEEYDQYSAALPLKQKMQLMFSASINDPMQIGYELGLSYVSQIRDQHKSVKQVEEEIKEFKVACRKDPDTFNRFITGFKIALEADKGKDLPSEIYTRFINYN